MHEKILDMNLDWQDPWVVGIGGGIISGIIVFSITQFFFNKQGKSELARKISTANQELIMSVRHGIPDNATPSAQTLKALIQATSRKYSLAVNEVYGAKEIAQDLIKEVMDSSFISSDTKAEYCEKLLQLGTSTSEHSPTQHTALSREDERININKVMSLTLALVSGVMSAVLAANYALFVKLPESGDFSNNSIPVVVMLPVAITTLAAIVAVLLTRIIRRKTAGSASRSTTGQPPTALVINAAGEPADSEDKAA